MSKNSGKLRYVMKHYVQFSAYHTICLKQSFMENIKCSVIALNAWGEMLEPLSNWPSIGWHWNHRMFNESPGNSCWRFATPVYWTGNRRPVACYTWSSFAHWLCVSGHFALLKLKYSVWETNRSPSLKRRITRLMTAFLTVRVTRVNGRSSTT